MRRWLQSLILPLTGGALLAACAQFGTSSPPAVMSGMPESRRSLQDELAHYSGRSAWPRENWWTSFGQPELNRLMETALAGNPDLKTAAARLRQSQALVDAAAAELYPTVDAHISFSAQRFSANSVQVKFAGEDFRLSLVDPFVLRYHLDFWGSDRASLQAAVDHSFAVAAEWADARLLLTAAVAGSYFDLLVADSHRRIAEQLVADLERLLRLELTRRAAGLSADAPTLVTESAAQEARQTLATAQASVQLARHRLAALAGKGTDWGRWIAAGELAHIDPPAFPRDLPLRFLEHRPDLAAARLEAESVSESVKVAQTAFYPDVNLIAFAGLHGVSLSDVLLQGSSLAYALGPSVTFPIFEGGRLRARLADREAAYDVAVERYNATLLRAIQDVADALTRWREVDLRLTQQVHRAADAERVMRLAESLSTAGLSDASGPLRARIELTLQNWRLASLKGEQGKAAVALCRALGGGYQLRQETGSRG
jgi:NodT family efflux transporter outer membrane factor (OMF) lipoprotein